VIQAECPAAVALLVLGAGEVAAVIVVGRRGKRAGRMR
jgi:hypothetical protein